MTAKWNHDYVYQIAHDCVLLVGIKKESFLAICAVNFIICLRSSIRDKRSLLCTFATNQLRKVNRQLNTLVYVVFERLATMLKYPMRFSDALFAQSLVQQSAAYMHKMQNQIELNNYYGRMILHRTITRSVHVQLLAAAQKHTGSVDTCVIRIMRSRTNRMCLRLWIDRIRVVHLQMMSQMQYCVYPSCRSVQFTHLKHPCPLHVTCHKHTPVHGMLCTCNAPTSVRPSTWQILLAMKKPLQILPRP